MRKHLTLLAVFALVVAACSSNEGGDTTTPEETTTTAAPEPISMGYIMEARPAEQPWSAAIHDSGVLLQERNPGLETTETFDAYDPTSAEPNARQLLEQGAAVVVFHSFALDDIAHSLAGEFPDVPMSVSSFSEPVEPNLNIATASYLQIGYTNCWLLASLSESGKIGFVGAEPIPYATELQLGCELGAAAADESVEVLSAYSNSFIDQQTTREAAQGLLEEGIDGLFPASATEDSIGGFQLCEQEGINCVGWAADARRFAPETAVTSAVIDWTVLLQRMLDESQSGNLTVETFDATYQNGGLISPPFEGAAADRVPADIQEAYADLVQSIIDGEVDFPASEAHPCCP